MAEDEINFEKNEEVEEQKFDMSEDEIEDAKKTNFNPFWITKEMELNKAYKFEVISNVAIRDIKDVEAEKKTPRMVIAIKELESGMVYDLIANKDENTKTGKFSSMSLAMRRLYAMTDKKPKGKMISLVRTEYKHEKYGDTSAFNINLLEPTSK